jgi:hypothetical protein
MYEKDLMARLERIEQRSDTHTLMIKAIFSGMGGDTSKFEVLVPLVEQNRREGLLGGKNGQIKSKG